MLRFSSFAAIAFIGLAFASPARAVECEKTLSLGVGHGYVYSYSGGYGTEKPVTQNDITLDCGNWSFNLWISAELTTRSPFGNRGGGDEIDLTASYSNYIGESSFDYSISVAYYIIGFEGPGNGFNSLKDDFGFLSAEIGRPFSVGAASMRPLVEFATYLPIDGSRTSKFVRTGAEFLLPLSDSWSVSTKLTVSFDLDGGSKLDSEASLNYELDDGWMISGQARKVGGDQAGLISINFRP